MKMRVLAVVSIVAVAALVPVLYAADLGTVVIKRLGKVIPTPGPTPKDEERLRLVASFTLQNKPSGKSIISFEVAEFGESKGSYRTLAIQQYSLIEPKTEAIALRDEIVGKIRALESDLLRFAEIVGAPRGPASIYDAGVGAPP